MFEHLTQQERKEMANVLESYTVKCEGTATPLALDDGIILPPVPLLKFPHVRYANERPFLLPILNFNVRIISFFDIRNKNPA